jgi:ATP-dependent RNA helicase RhlE
MQFTDLGLSEPIVRAVSDAGYTQPTPIQAQAIPVVLGGADLLAGAQTGTGKTAAFVLPLLQRLSAPAPEVEGARRRRIRALIVTPTRELAAQVEESVRVYGRHLPLTSFSMFGGVSINPQIDQLRRGVDILVATPGRLLDHHGQRTIDLSGVEVLVLDEADRMLDMGFLPDIKRVLAILPRQRQNLLFSATFADPIRSLAESLLKSPQQIQVTPRNSTVEAVAQTIHPVDAGRKAELLVHLVREGNWFQVLVFTRTKHGANKLATRLDKCGVPALAIHGNKSQNARTRALAEFKSGKLQVLVATDIAARGLDIEQLPHVVNFELPHVPEDYVHRIGRTGRAGAVGEAVSLVSGEESGRLRDIERLIRRTLPRVAIAGFEPGSVGQQPLEDIEADERPPLAGGRGRRGGSAGAGRARPSGGSSGAGRSRSAGGGQGSSRPRTAGGEGEGRSRSAGSAEGAPARARAPRPAASGAGQREGNRDGNRDGNRAGGRDGNRDGSSAGNGAPQGATGNRRGGRPGAEPGARSESGRGRPAGESGNRSEGSRGRPAAPGNAMVRSNLPPGWSPSGTPRRGR